jgi:hypothetical protein
MRNTEDVYRIHLSARDCLDNTRTKCVGPCLDNYQSQSPVYDDMMITMTTLIFKYITRYLK